MKYSDGLDLHKQAQAEVDAMAGGVPVDDGHAAFLRSIADDYIRMFLPRYRITYRQAVLNGTAASHVMGANMARKADKARFLATRLDQAAMTNKDYIHTGRVTREVIYRSLLHQPEEELDKMMRQHFNGGLIRG